MPDFPKMSAGGVDQYAPVDRNFFLFAGEAETPTSRGKVKSNQNLPIFSLVAYDANGLLVPWDYDGGTLGTMYADGTLTMGGQPTANDTVTIGSTVITFVSGTPTGNQVQIGASAAATANNLRAFIIANSSTLGVNVSSGGATGGTPIALTANAAGTAGNSIALAKSGTYPSVSGATLSGGADIEAGATPESKLVGVLAQAINTTSTGYNADTFCPYYEAGVFNHEALSWPAALDTLQKRKAAVAGSRISVDRLP